MKYLGIILILFLLIIGATATPVSAASLKIHFIDVGEGDAVLIQAPGGKAVMIDSGNLISGYRVVEYLKKNDIAKLERLVFTHPHPDHIGGAFFILQMMEVGRVCDNGQVLQPGALDADIYRWYSELVRKRNNYHILKAGDRFSVDGVIFKVLWPAQPLPSLDFNANSLVIMIEYKKAKILLTGDLTTSGEALLLEKTADLKANLLKVGHHGFGSSSEEFLKVVSPEISIISVNKDNVMGYPSQEGLKSLKDSGSKIYRTDRDGDIIINVTEEGELGIETSQPGLLELPFRPD